MDISGLIMLAFGSAIVIVVVGVIVYVAADSARKKEKRKRAAAREAAAYHEHMRWLMNKERLGGIPAVKGISLPRGEECYYASYAILKEPRAVTISRHGGGSVGVVSGVRLFDGVTISETHDEWRTVSTGILYITAERLIFAGDTQNRTVDLADVVSLGAAARSVSVGTTSRQNVMVFSGVNGAIVRDTILAMR